MIFRFRYIVLGGHTHLRLFAGKTEAGLGKCGDLIFRNEEWEEFLKRIGAGFEVLPEEPRHEQDLSR